MAAALLGVAVSVTIGLVADRRARRAEAFARAAEMRAREAEERDLKRWRPRIIAAAECHEQFVCVRLVNAGGSAARHVNFRFEKESSSDPAINPLRGTQMDGLTYLEQRERAEWEPNEPIHARCAPIQDVREGIRHDWVVIVRCDYEDLTGHRLMTDPLKVSLRTPVLELTDDASLLKVVKETPREVLAPEKFAGLPTRIVGLVGDRRVARVAVLSEMTRKGYGSDEVNAVIAELIDGGILVEDGRGSLMKGRRSL